MTPRTALAEEYGIMKADEILSVLRQAGYIVVDKGAVGRAQREAVGEVQDILKAWNYGPFGEEYNRCALEALMDLVGDGTLATKAA